MVFVHPQIHRAIMMKATTLDQRAAALAALQVSSTLSSLLDQLTSKAFYRLLIAGDHAEAGARHKERSRSQRQSSGQTIIGQRPMSMDLRAYRTSGLPDSATEKPYHPFAGLATPA
jgi:hypothetical protein